MDCQGLVARLVLDFVLLTAAVEVASRWRELAEKLARVSRQQMEAYEAPHRDKNGLLDNEVGPLRESHTRVFKDLLDNIKSGEQGRTSSGKKNLLKKLLSFFPSL